jgi:hypothetical protein
MDRCSVSIKCVDEFFTAPTSKEDGVMLERHMHRSGKILGLFPMCALNKQQEFSQDIRRGFLCCACVLQGRRSG